MNETMNDRFDNLKRAISAVRVPATPGEYDLHALIAQALATENIPFAHEAKIAPGCRIDFLANGIGIEVKKAKPTRTLLLRQAAKYLRAEAVEGLLVVSEKGVALPGKIAGKPVRVLSLSRLWGVALS